ncbi:hypothetical protein CMU70_14495 [Elizabethkingia anophelis]|nr:hypothetical protein [Elizabethkingia anophelis]
MEAKEIRLGNYLNHNGFVPTIVDAIDIIHCKQYPEVYNPIELTEEWLLKFGFTHEVIAYYYFEKIYKKGSFTLSESFVLLDIDLNVKVDYVHQLQNLYYALIGEELKLQIPE